MSSMPPLFRPADHGRKNVNLAGDATKITAEDATIAATAGDANLSNAAVAAGSFEASATQNLTAENLAVTVGTDETGAAGDVTITARRATWRSPTRSSPERKAALATWPCRRAATLSSTVS